MSEMLAIIPLGWMRRNKKTYHIGCHGQVDQGVADMQIVGEDIEDREVYVG